MPHLAPTVRKALECTRLHARAVEDSARLARLANSLQIGILSADAEGRIYDCNDVLWRLLGYDSKQAFLAMPNTHHYVDPQARKSMLAELQAYGTVKDFTAEYRKADGSTLWADAQFAAIKDASGHLTGTEALFTDATKRVLTEQAASSARASAAASDSRLTHLVQDLNIGVFTADLQGQPLDCNDILWQQFGYPSKSAFLAVSTLQHFVDPSVLLATLANLRSGPTQEVIAELRRADGSTAWHSTMFRLATDSSGQPTGISALSIDVTDRVLATRAAAAAATDYARLLADLNVVYVFADMEGHILDCNDTCWQILGYPDKQTILGVSIASRYVDPALRTRMLTLLTQQGLIKNFEIELRKFDDSSLWFSIEFRLVKDALDRPVGLKALAVDITDRVLAQKATLQANARLDLLMQDLRVGIVTTDLQGQVLDCNDVTWRQAGYPSKQAFLAVPSLQHFANPQALSGALDSFQPDSSGGALTAEYRRADGSTAWYDTMFRITTDSSGQPTGTEALSVDVTTRVRAEQESALDHARLGTALSLAPILLATVDQDLNFTFAGGGVRGNFIDGQLFLGASARISLQGHPNLIQALEQALAGQASQQDAEVNGTWLHFRFSPLAADSIKGASVVAFDVTDRHQMQVMRSDMIRRLIEAQEEERSRIAIEIHDDAVQVMTAASMHLHLLAASLSDPRQQAQATKLLSTVTSSIGRLRNLLFDLNPPALERLGLHAALSAMCEEFQNIASVPPLLLCHFTHEPSPSTSLAIYRATQEALINVRKHAQAHHVQITLTPSLGGLSVSIRDDGVGFDSSAPHLSANGHLGLSSMRERVELVGGRFSITSSLGSGTQVEFWIPDSTLSSPLPTEVAS